jgi:hypothetical protein
MDLQLDLNAFIDDGGKRTPCHIRVSAPIPSQDDDFYCKVHAPTLRVVEKRVFGVDEAQARELSIKLLVSMLGNKRLVDDDGRAIDLSGL